jgi:flagellar motor switch protein FliN/FliY
MAGNARSTGRSAIANESVPVAQPLELLDFTTGDVSDHAATSDSFPNAQLDLRIELGRTWLSPKEETELAGGSIVPLDKSSSDWVDVVVNGRLIARGEVVVLNDNLCVRIAEIVIPKAA